MYLKPKLIRTDKEGHYIVKEKKIYQEDVAVSNIYAPDIRAHESVKETLVKYKSHIDPHTLTVGDFNTQLSPLESYPDKNKPK